MDNKSNYKYLLSDLTSLKGVGIKTTNLLKKKKVIALNLIFHLEWFQEKLERMIYIFPKMT